MLKKLKSKLKSRSGLTLTEMLITVILLMFFSSACLLGISAAISTRRDMIKASDADILCSTVTQYISNELRLCLFPTNVSEEGIEKFRYSGGSTYANLPTTNTYIWIDSEGYIWRSIGDVSFLVFNKSAYGVDSPYGGFTIAAPESDEFISVDYDKDIITCSFVIKDSNGNIVKTEDDTRFTVTPINPVTPPSGT